MQTAKDADQSDHRNPNFQSEGAHYMPRFDWSCCMTSISALA